MMCHTHKSTNMKHVAILW